ncbi:hypothetical protein KIN20_029359 [Parelaphostrongylus tenuis]|uniref:Uncharacterized protein n=1 Tax=Parelaphostrongylus tenuis TaxID=148309 RepID=A0AAD5R287_PARTN|nr:hypothetical protein KIN20_029359 [Parelaphostrongylus tenuis]
MTNLHINPFIISLLATISTVLGCGVLPAGQASTRTFTVTGFTLPVSMAYTDMTDVIARVPGIATSRERAQAFVERLVMQTVFDVLESEARSALLPDAVISAILGQLSVKITYEPLPCPIVALNLMNDQVNLNSHPQRCIVVGNTVTGICASTEAANGQCLPLMKAEIRPIPASHMSITGNIMTTNIIMANWSTAMWRNVVNRAIRMLASGPHGWHFFLATATVSET